MVGLATGALVICAAASLTAGDWPGWRGPGGRGVSSETGLALQWDAESNVAWKTAIPGRGHSSPIVWGDHVFLTTAIEGDVVPGAGAPKHMIGEDEFVHPQSVDCPRPPASWLRR